MFSHKGININVGSDGKFVADTPSGRVEAPTLEEVKKEVELALKQATLSKLQLPVICFRTVSRWNHKEDTTALVTGTLEGINRTTRELLIKGVKGSCIYVLPDTEECRDLLKSYKEAQEALRAVTDSIEARRLDKHGYGRIELADYDKVMTELKYNHALVSQGQVIPGRGK